MVCAFLVNRTKYSKIIYFQYLLQLQALGGVSCAGARLLLPNMPKKFFIKPLSLLFSFGCAKYASYFPAVAENPEIPINTVENVNRTVAIM